jgi:hypothetical protein
MLDQVGADGAEQPARQRPAGTMAYNDEICSYLFSDLGDLRSRRSHSRRQQLTHI